jgi:hypothetical protein
MAAGWEKVKYPSQMRRLSPGDLPSVFHNFKLGEEKSFGSRSVLFIHSLYQINFRNISSRQLKQFYYDFSAAGGF